MHQLVETDARYHGITERMCFGISLSIMFTTPPLKELQPHYFSVTSDTSGSSVTPFLNVNQWEETHCGCM